MYDSYSMAIDIFSYAYNMMCAHVACNEHTWLNAVSKLLVLYLDWDVAGVVFTGLLAFTRCRTHN